MAGADVTALAQYNASGSNGWLDELPDETLENVTIQRSDIRDPGAMDQLVKDQEVVFHLAALIAIPYSYSAPQSYIDVNVTGTLNIMEASRRRGVSRVIQTSTSEVYGTAQTHPISEEHPLQAQSAAAASKIVGYGGTIVCALLRRACRHFAAIQYIRTAAKERAVIPTAIRQALDPECEAIRIGDTTPKRDFCFVQDTVRAFVLAGEHNELQFGSPYNAGPVTPIIGDMIEIVRRLSGSNKPLETDADRMRLRNSEVFELIADASKLGGDGLVS